MKLIKELLESGFPTPKYTWDEAVDFATEVAEAVRRDVLILQRASDNEDQYEVVFSDAYMHWSFDLRDLYDIVASVNPQGKISHRHPHAQAMEESAGDPTQQFLDHLARHKPRAKDKTNLIMKMINKNQVSDLIDWIGVNREKIYDVLGKDVTMRKLIKALSTSAGWKKYTDFRGY